MLELAILAVAGMFLGAGLGARRRRAPIPLVRTFYVFSGVCLLLAMLTVRPGH